MLYFPVKKKIIIWTTVFRLKGENQSLPNLLQISLQKRVQTEFLLVIFILGSLWVILIFQLIMCMDR